MNVLQSARPAKKRRIFVAGVVGFLLACADGFAFYGAYGLGAFLLTQIADRNVPYYLEFSVMISLATAWLAVQGHYRPGQGFHAETKDIAVTCLGLLLLSGAAYGALDLWERYEAVAMALICSIVIVPIIRYSAVIMAHGRGHWRLPAVVIGDPESARTIGQAATRSPYTGIDLLETVSFETLFGPDMGGTRPRDAARAEDYLLRRYGRNRHLLFIMPLTTRTALKTAELIPIFARHGFRLALSPLSRDVSLPGLERRRLDGLKGGLYVSNPGDVHPVEATGFPASKPRGRWLGDLIKRLMDVTVSGLALIALLPFFLPLMFLIRQDGGPAFFAQTRVGKGGKPFKCLKFRTMVVDAEKRLKDLLASDPQAAEEWARDQKLRKDPRVTNVGNFLRKSSFDEIPQLLNILKGDMSLVGPRPVIPSELERYGDCARYYLSVRPGLTGLWQVSGRNNTTYQERVMLDTTYALKGGLKQDIIIILKTFAEVLWKRSGF